MPILQRFVSKYPPRYYLGPDRLSRGIPVNLSDFEEFIKPYPPPYKGEENEPIISNFDSWRCWHELYYFLKWNDFGKHFAFSEAKHGVCSCFRGECEFSLQVDDRFAIEVHAFELQSPWDDPKKSPQIRRYIGAFFFASNGDPHQNREWEKECHDKLSIQHSKYKTLDEIYSGRKQWPDLNDLYPKRWLREAIVRRPQHIIRPPYRLVRFFPLSLNYGLEGFDGIPYAFPGNDGRCIHAAIYLATLLTSQWSIPIPPIEATFHLAMVTQTNIQRLNECFNGLQDIVTQYDVNFSGVPNFYEIYEKCFCVFRGSKNYLEQKKKREDLDKALDAAQNYLIRQLEFLVQAGTLPITMIDEKIKPLFNRIKTSCRDICRSCVEIEIMPQFCSKGCNFGELNQYFMNVRGMSISAAAEIMNREGATSAAAIEEVFEPAQLKRIAPDPYILHFARTIFAHILRCYLDERIPVIVPVRFSKLPGRQPQKDDYEDIDHVVLAIGYRPGVTQRIDDIRLVFIDSDETGLYRECSFDEFFTASVPYDPVSGTNLMTKDKKFPSIHMLVSMPKGFRFSFRDAISEALVKYVRKTSAVGGQGANSGVTYYLQSDRFPILCQGKKLYSFLSDRLVLKDSEARFLKEYSWPNFVWVETPDGYTREQVYDIGTADFPIRIYNPYVDVHSFWPATIQNIKGQPFRIQVVDTEMNLKQIEQFVLSL